MMPSTRLLLSLLLFLTSHSGLVQSASASGPTLTTAYDYHLLDQTYQAIALPELVAALQDSDVIFIGEYHGNHASHLLQMQLFAALHQQQASQATILSMEMFNRDQQAILDRYMEGDIGERTLIDKAPTWKNYRASYRPLVEYAKQHQIPVIAANAAADLIRCIGRQGSDYIDKLTAEEKRYIASQPFAEVPNYKAKFMGFMAGSNHLSRERAHQSYLAQLARDNTMAEAIATALAQTPNSQVIHLNGTFHSAEHLGTVGALKRLNPDLKLSVITPIYPQDWQDAKAHAQCEKPHPNEFYYLLQPQPRDFVSTTERDQAYQALFDQAKEKAKACR